MLFFSNKAKILADGSYQELQASGFNFVKLIGSSEDTINEPHSMATESNPNTFPLLSTQDSNKNSIHEKSHGDLTNPNEEPEICASGRVPQNVYKSYFSAGENTFKIFLCFFLYFLTQVVTTGGDYWLSYWYRG